MNNTVDFLYAFETGSDERALPGESWLKTGAGAPPMSRCTSNWAGGIPRLNLIISALVWQGQNINFEIASLSG